MPLESISTRVEGQTQDKHSQAFVFHGKHAFHGSKPLRFLDLALCAEAAQSDVVKGGLTTRVRTIAVCDRVLFSWISFWKKLRCRS